MASDRSRPGTTLVLDTGAAAGGGGLDSGSAPALARAEGGAARAAAASMARPASTLPAPEPAAAPGAGLYTVLVVSAELTCAGVRPGYWARISAARPATIALAADVLFTVVKPPVSLSATTFTPPAVTFT